MSGAAPPPTIRLHATDNVVVAQRALPPGTTVAAESVTARDAVPAGHKIATAPIRAGEAVRRYGQIIGFATADIAAGAHVHTHNLALRDFARDYAFATL